MGGCNVLHMSEELKKISNADFILSNFTKSILIFNFTEIGTRTR